MPAACAALLVVAASITPTQQPALMNWKKAVAAVSH
jgi:hypothetical protein